MGFNKLEEMLSNPGPKVGFHFIKVQYMDYSIESIHVLFFIQWMSTTYPNPVGLYHPQFIKQLMLYLASFQLSMITSHLRDAGSIFQSGH